jgi:hypothetical protein
MGNRGGFLDAFNAVLDQLGQPIQPEAIHVLTHAILKTSNICRRASRLKGSSEVHNRFSFKELRPCSLIA